MTDVTHYAPNIPITELPKTLSLTTGHGGRTTIFSSISGRRKSYTYEPRCGVCKVDPEILDDIHRMAANGVTVAAIGKSIDRSARLSNRQIRHHLVTHVSEYALYERALASAAQAFGEGEFPARVSGLFMSQIMMQRGTMLMAEGRVEIRASDMMAAARFQYEMEKEGKDIADASTYSEAMTIVLSKFYEAVGPARFNAVMWSLASDPRMAEIMRETGLSPASAIEAEVESSPMRTLINSL